RLDEVIPTHLCPQLVLELTEHIPVEDYEAVLTALATLRGHGMRLAVDDTGAGYAGFRHLLSLQPEIIKLDISLTRGVDTLASHRALASALAVFAAAVGAQLLAEGVESVSEMETLRELGLSWMQGYYFGRPSVGLDAVAGC
ncbi:MAG: EAL domain-containing protein, partial [Jatrophihabitantaceae bacterium]